MAAWCWTPELRPGLKVTGIDLSAPCCRSFERIGSDMRVAGSPEASSHDVVNYANPERPELSTFGTSSLLHAKVPFNNLGVGGNSYIDQNLDFCILSLSKVVPKSFHHSFEFMTEFSYIIVPALLAGRYSSYGNLRGLTCKLLRLCMRPSPNTTAPASGPPAFLDNPLVFAATMGTILLVGCVVISALIILRFEATFHKEQRRRDEAYGAYNGENSERASHYTQAQIASMSEPFLEEGTWSPLRGDLEGAAPRSPTLTHCVKKMLAVEKEKKSTAAARRTGSRNGSRQGSRRGSRRPSLTALVIAEALGVESDGVIPVLSTRYSYQNYAGASNPRPPLSPTPPRVPQGYRCFIAYRRPPSAAAIQLGTLLRSSGWTLCEEPPRNALATKATVSGAHTSPMVGERRAVARMIAALTRAVEAAQLVILVLEPSVFVDPYVQHCMLIATGTLPCVVVVVVLLLLPLLPLLLIQILLSLLDSRGAPHRGGAWRQY